MVTTVVEVAVMQIRVFPMLLMCLTSVVALWFVFAGGVVALWLTLWLWLPG